MTHIDSDGKDIADTIVQIFKSRRAAADQLRMNAPVKTAAIQDQLDVGACA